MINYQSKSQPPGLDAWPHICSGNQKSPGSVSDCRLNFPLSLSKYSWKLCAIFICAVIYIYWSHELQVRQLCLPETIFVFLLCPHMRSSLVENSISPLKTCLTCSCFDYQRHNGDPFFFFCLVEQQTRLTAGDPADLPSVCPGEDPGSGELLDMFWLEMTLARDTKRWGRSRKSEVWGARVNLIPQCLDVFRFIVAPHRVPRVSVCCLCASHNFSWQVYTRWPHTIRLLF